LLWDSPLKYTTEYFVDGTIFTTVVETIPFEVNAELENSE
jgi:hypothetical protein